MKISLKRAGLLYLCLSGLLYGVVLSGIFATPALADSGKSAYFCQEGDSIGQIAAAHGIDSQLLAAMNNMGVYARLSPGRLLWLPKEPSQEITIAKGDTLWDLARKHHTSVEEILALNNLDNPHRLRIGDKLQIPCTNPHDPAESSPRVALAMAQAQPASRGGGFITPLEGVITSPYGQRKSGFHHGLDIAAPTGTLIYAAKAGTVTLAGWRSGIYGNTVEIDHGNEEKTVYGHASQILVKKGQRVSQGQAIAKVGGTGNATGPHLHLEIHIGGKVVDPQKYLR